MAKPKKDAVAVREDRMAQTQANLPAFMRGKAGQGVETLTSQDVEVPRLQLLQALSPQVQEADFKQGEFFHSVAEESLGKEVALSIVYVNKTYMLWRPRDAGGGILARSMDGIRWSPPDQAFTVKVNKHDVTWRTRPTVAASGLAEWGTMDPQDPQSPPAATVMYNLVAMIPAFPEYSPCVITLQRSAVRVARKLMGKLKLSQAPVYGLRFLMSSFKDSSSQGEFWNYKFQGTGLVESEEQFKIYEAMYERFKAEGLRIRDVEGIQADATPEGGPDKAGEAASKKYEGKI